MVTDALTSRSADASAAVSALQLRILVLALGETTSPPWWRTNLLSTTGRRFCERMFPRTTLAAAVNACGRAACAAHDEAIGRRGVFHLFRLPEAVERDIRQVLTQPGSEREHLESLLGSTENTMERLVRMSAATTSATIGPKKLGTVSDLGKAETYKRMAGAYLSGFKTGGKAFPYVEADE